MKFDYQQRTNTKIEDSPVGKLLHNLHMQSAFFTHSTLHSPWAMTMPAMPHCMMFHLVINGAASFARNNETWHLQQGDFILFPKGEGHQLSDGSCQQFTPLSDLPIVSVTERFETLEFGGSLGQVSGANTPGSKQQPPVQMVCGVLLFQHPLAIKLLGILPSAITIKQGDNQASEVITSISHLIGSETQQPGTGAEAVLSRLADILVITAMRQHLQQLEEADTGWLNALEDDRIGKALQLLHDNPQKHWSLEELAESVAMSRTSFAQQFKRLVGNTPIDYLTEWRMSLAWSRLESSKDTVLAIALDVGYQSEASFSRAFKKVVGKSPGEVRKAAVSPAN